MKQRVFLIAKIVIGIGVLLTFLVMIQTKSMETKKEQKKAELEKVSKLNIALVNEDSGILYQNKEYKLGHNYIKKIERDTAQQWYVVSRGIGESGLRNGNYHVMITIPSSVTK